MSYLKTVRRTMQSGAPFGGNAYASSNIIPLGATARRSYGALNRTQPSGAAAEAPTTAEYVGYGVGGVIAGVLLSIGVGRLMK